MGIETLTEQLAQFNPALAQAMQENIWIFPLFIFGIVMKITFYPWALYKAAVRKQKGWFIALFICFLFLNDMGLVPIIYLFINRERKETKPQKASVKKKL